MGVEVWCAIAVSLLVEWLRWTDQRDWNAVTDRLWRQEMRDKYPEFRS